MLRLLSRDPSLRIGALALALTACSAGKLRYEPVGFDIPAPDPEKKESYAAALHSRLAKGRLASLSVSDGRSLTPVTAAQHVHELPLSLCYAGLVGSGRWMRGAEIDLVLQGPEGHEMVTLWRSTQGDLRVASGGEPPEPRDLPAHGDALAWGAELAEAYGLLRVENVDKSWTLEEMEAVARALEELDEPERARVAELVLGRMAASPRAPGSELALYDSTELPARIDFFDLGFGRYGGGFVGSLDRPSRAPVMTVVHELGHAIADYPSRRAYAAYSDVFDRLQSEPELEGKLALMQDVDASWQRFREVQRMDPVIAAYRRVRGKRRGPTSYGWSRIRESFAEAFALYKLDPEALYRVMPEVHAWFEAGGHLAWTPD